MTKMTGGAALVEMLRRNGVDTIFALPGVQNDALFVAFYDAGEALRVIHTRHEQGAAYMAFGFARATGKIGTYAVEVKDDQGDLVAQFQGLAYRKKDKLAV